MACKSSTIELRGESDVSDALAEKDALALYNFLKGRDYISEDTDLGQDEGELGLG